MKRFLLRAISVVYILSSVLKLTTIIIFYQGLNFDDLNLVSSLVYDIQQQFAREEDVELARKTLDETLFSVFHHVISEAPVTKGRSKFYLTLNLYNIIFKYPQLNT